MAIMMSIILATCGSNDQESISSVVEDEKVDTEKIDINNDTFMIQLSKYSNALYLTSPYKLC